MAVKRYLSDIQVSSSPKSKRYKFTQFDRFSCLSDELLIRVLSFLPVPSLVVCQRQGKAS